MNQNSSLFIVEDQKLLRIGLRVALEGSTCCTVVGEAGDGLAAVHDALKLSPQVILMDIGLPGIDGIEATWRIKSALPHTKVIMFTSNTEADSVTAAFGAGADGYCVKSAPVEQILSAIKSVADGGTYLDPAIADSVVRNQKTAIAPIVKLSEAELEILALIRDELDNREIAARLNVSPESVVRVIHNVISKFVVKKVFAETSAMKERGKLNDWLTALVENLDKEAIFNEKYVIQSLIGTGGIGAVFKANHLYINREVAIKMLHPELIQDTLLMRGFQREATAVANLHHKNVISVYDFGLSENHQPYLVMEYIDGRNLSDVILEEGYLETIRALKLFAQICEGLSAAHERGIVHCDLKPSNILLTNFDNDEVVKLVDFGLVQMLPQNSLSKLDPTDKYTISGTPTYMSPEQCLGKSLDERSDIYSLGCVIFETLTGKPLFEADTALEIFAHHLHTKPPSMRSIASRQFGDALEQLVARMLSKKPADRPQNMHEVKNAILHSAMAIQEHLEGSTRDVASI